MTETRAPSASDTQEQQAVLWAHARRSKERERRVWAADAGEEVFQHRRRCSSRGARSSATLPGTRWAGTPRAGGASRELGTRAGARTFAGAVVLGELAEELAAVLAWAVLLGARGQMELAGEVRREGDGPEDALRADSVERLGVEARFGGHGGGPKRRWSTFTLRSCDGACDCTGRGADDAQATRDRCVCRRTAALTGPGASSVGKSSLLLRFTDELFLPPDETSATIGVDFKVKLITRREKRIKLSIWASPSSRQRR